jgi:hypothetical protein
MYKQFETKDQAQTFIDEVNELKGYDPNSDQATNNYANPIQGVNGWFVVCTDEVIEQMELTDLVEEFEQLQQYE